MIESLFCLVALLGVAGVAIAGDVSFPFLQNNAEALLVIMVAAVLGGCAQYSRRIKARRALFSLAELIGEISISASAGTLCGFVAMHHYGSGSMWIVAAAAGAGGHMGTRVFFLIDQLVTAQLRRRFGLDDDPPPA